MYPLCIWRLKQEKEIGKEINKYCHYKTFTQTGLLSYPRDQKGSNSSLWKIGLLEEGDTHGPGPKLWKA